MDSKGLIHDYRGDKLAEHKKEFSRKEEDLKDAGQIKNIYEIIKYCKANAIIGLTGWINVQYIYILKLYYIDIE